MCCRKTFRRDSSQQERTSQFLQPSRGNRFRSVSSFARRCCHAMPFHDGKWWTKTGSFASQSTRGFGVQFRLSQFSCARQSQRVRMPRIAFSNRYRDCSLRAFSRFMTGSVWLSLLSSVFHVRLDHATHRSVPKNIATIASNAIIYKIC